MDISKLNREEKLDLLNQAKDAYYNTGQEILTDYEYDELEAELGLENKNYVGSKAGNYDTKHTFIMGSLSKIQVHEDPKTKMVNWDELAEKFDLYFNKAKHCQYIETTPKLDGCSFSAEFTIKNGKYKFDTCATRGNGTYGTDISHLFIPQLNKSEWSDIEDACEALLDEGDILCIRGEVLIPHSKFTEQYAKQYTNPRSFVSGQLGLKASEITDDTLSVKDLHFVCYDYRIVDASSKKYHELSWMNPNDKTYSILQPYLNHIGELPDKEYCKVYPYNGHLEPEQLQEIYEEYAKFRAESSEYALDGVVFKPEASARQYNEDRPRPVDCVAMKFIPMSAVSEIIDIQWEAKKTGEYKPIAILKPIWLDGKKIQKASLNNYNDIIKKNCGIGSTVEISLAGDIIPHIYKVINAAGVDELNLPEDSEVIQSKSGNYKLMKVYADENSKIKDQFLASANELKINNVGPAAASKIWDVLHNDFNNLDNIIDIMTEDAYELIYEYLGNAKSISNIVKSLQLYAEHITLFDIIRSCCIPGCRDKSAHVCEKILSGLSYDTTSINRASYQWALDPSDPNYIKVMDYVDMFSIDLDAAKQEVQATEASAGEKIPVVMTGSPKEFGYKTKAEFLAAHPEYVDAGSSVKDCKILFTDDLSSTSGKMKQAAKYGVEVRLYESFHF